jgi:hypothetical protein
MQDLSLARDDNLGRSCVATQSRARGRKNLRKRFELSEAIERLERFELFNPTAG